MRSNHVEVQMFTRKRRFAVLLAAIVAGSLALAGPAQADFVVDDLDDVAVVAADGMCDAPGVGETCTLREALNESNNTVGLDTITFSVNGPITTSGVGQLTTIQPTIIDGNGPANTIIDGADVVNLFIVNGAATTFKDIRLEDGALADPGGDGGAAIFASNAPASNVTLDNAVVTSNQVTGEGAGFGAGIYMTNPGATLTVNNSTVSDNTINVSTNAALGGGIAAIGTVNLTDSTVSGNVITSAASQPQGAGIFANAGFSIQRSTVSGNMTGANGTGGALYNGGGAGTRTISNSTISTNTAGSAGPGGIDLPANTTITNVTFALNTETVGTGNDLLVSNAAVVTLRNTILGSGSGAGADPACNAIGGATVVSTVPGNNIDSDTSLNCGLGTTNGNRQNTNPLLGGLLLNAPGTTMTHALMTGSPAIDTATPDCGGLTTDQRGLARPQPTGGVCDVGSFEVAQATPPPAGGGTTPVTPVTPAATENAACAALRAKLKKAKSKRKKKKIRAQLRKLGC